MINIIARRVPRRVINFFLIVLFSLIALLSFTEFLSIYTAPLSPIEGLNDNKNTILASLYKGSRYILPEFQLTNSDPKFLISHNNVKKNIFSDNDDSAVHAHNSDQNSRYESNDAWRSDDSYAQLNPQRIDLPSPDKYISKGDYLQQPLVADYPKGAENMFFMLKTGGSVLWKRLPVHIFTTLTRTPNFALYSDSPGSIAGYEVIDILQNITDESIINSELDLYRRQRFIHDTHRIVDYSEIEVAGGWELDKFKNIPMLAHAYSISPSSDWFVYMDDDSYMMLDTLMEWLNTLDPEIPLYLGSRALLADIEFAHGGSGVVLSRKAVELTVGDHPEYIKEYEEKAFDYCCGDFMVALMLKEKLDLDISTRTDYPTVEYKFQGNSFYNVMVTEEKWCQPILSFHHLSPHDIEILWEYERLKGPNSKSNITYGSIYRDFYLPYLDDQIKDWDNEADEINYSYKMDQSIGINASYEGGKDNRPYENVEECKKVCDILDTCVMYRWLPQANYCGLSTTIKLGKPIYDWVNTYRENAELDNRGAISGWRIDRIRKMRKNQQCDPLHDDEHSEGTMGSPEFDRVEGWYHRLNGNIKTRPHLLTEAYKMLQSLPPYNGNQTKA